MPTVISDARGPFGRNVPLAAAIRARRPRRRPRHAGRDERRHRHLRAGRGDPGRAARPTSSPPPARRWPIPTGSARSAWATATSCAAASSPTTARGSTSTTSRSPASSGTASSSTTPDGPPGQRRQAASGGAGLAAAQCLMARAGRRHRSASARCARLRRLLVVVLLAGAAWIAWEAWTWPDVAALASRPPATTAFIERWRDGQRAAGRSDRVERAWVPYARISPHLKRAVLVAEDVNFFSHAGFDLGEIRQAIGKTIDEGVAPRGASTITQQLAKNLWLSPSRNPLRKIKEAILTWQLERRLGKLAHPRAVPERRRIRPGRVGRRGRRPALLRPRRPPISTRTQAAAAGGRAAEPDHLASRRQQPGVSAPRGHGAAADGQGGLSQEADRMTTAIFRDYDRTALDAEYNNRLKVKDALDWIARYGAESARARAELPMRFDVPYGAHHDERLDVFAASRLGPGADPDLHPRRLLAPPRQGRLQLRGPRVPSGRRADRRRQLRADSGRRHGRARAAGPRRRGLGPRARARARRRPRSDLRDRPLGRRPPGGDAARHRLERLRRARRRASRAPAA